MQYPWNGYSQTGFLFSRFIGIALFAVFLGLCQGACDFRGSRDGRSGDQGVPQRRGRNFLSTADKSRLTIGFSIATATFIIERWNKDLKVFTGAAQELGADVIVQLSAGGIQEQIAQINYMVNQNIDILVVIAHDTELIAGAIRQVKEAGIPVIAYDRLIQKVPLDAYVSFDSREVGRYFGEALRDAVPRGRYLVVNGSIYDVNSADINAGFYEIITPLINSGAVRIEREIWLEEWSSDEALEKIGLIFNETTNFDAIVCANDAIAGAAIRLLSERRLAGKIAVVGQDAELSGCQRIVEGTQLMTVYKPIGSLGVRAARLAVALVQKSRGIKQVEIPSPDIMMDNQSGTMIPSYLQKSTAIYKENIDIIIRDGFHSREDVFRNIGAP
ncbi:MAG: substrate-binding domain-containing protein [Spirochaetaceae bacterium]|jgi:D-xylose transport system substrate-binding protein|nr:substrate-binding domain-containing protein [Spirochaetaceae bacterium]